MEAELPLITVLRDWFKRRQSGCHFAGHLATREPRVDFLIHFASPASLSIEDIEDRIDAAANAGDVTLLVLPRARSEAEIADLARHLHTRERWRVQARPCPSSGPDLLGLSIEFITQAGARSATMGFAPSGHMPVTRRAPYMMLAIWGGGRDNPHFTRPGGTDVNFADVPTELTKESHDNMWTSSEAATRLRLVEPPFDSKWLRKISFCLPRPLAEPWLAT